MGYTARWGPKGFLVSSEKIVPVEQFTTSYKLKKDTNDASNDVSASNTRGRDLQPIAISTHYYRALGTDPREQIEEWASLIGEHYPLYLGEKRFGPDYVQLQSVSVTDTQTDNFGNILFCAISLAFEEYPVEEKKSSTSSGDASAVAGIAPPSGEYQITEITDAEKAEIQGSIVTPSQNPVLSQFVSAVQNVSSSSSADTKSTNQKNTVYKRSRGLTATSTEKTRLNPANKNSGRYAGLR